MSLFSAGFANPFIALSKATLYAQLNEKGYLIIPNALTPEQVVDLNRQIDISGFHYYQNKFPVLECGKDFVDLISNPALLAFLTPMLGPQFRFDAALGVQDIASKHHISLKEYHLHGGPYANQGAFQYHIYDGIPRPSILVCGYVLHGQTPETGGLALITGSHLPKEPITAELMRRAINEEEVPPYPVDIPTLNPGDLVIFTEALIHGNQAWHADGAIRRFLYYRYCPGYLCWKKYDAAQRQAIYDVSPSPILEDLLRPPYVGDYDEAKPDIVNEWRPINRWAAAQDDGRQANGISFCVTCKDRLEQIQETLEHNLNQAETALPKDMPWEFLLLDYNSPDELESWTHSHLADWIASGKLRYVKNTTAEFYHFAKAKNESHRAAQYDILVNVDADNFLSQFYMYALLTLRPHEIMYSPYYKGFIRGTGGRVALFRQAFEALNGYDEEVSEGWGYEDDDFKNRAAQVLGLTPRYIFSNLAGNALQHSDEMRFRHTVVKHSTKEAARTRSLNKMP